MKKYSLALLGTFAALSMANNAEAAFGITVKTTLSDSVTTQADRLFAAPGVNPELTDPFWVAITGSQPIPLTSGATTFFFNPADGIAGIVAALFGPDAGNAAVGGAFVSQGVISPGVGGDPNRVQKNYTGIDGAYQTGGTGGNNVGGQINPAYALLFDDANLLDGATFNFDLLSPAGAIPSVGNVEMRIGQDLFSQGFTLVAVPEPAIGAYVAAALGALALIRRRLGKAC